MWGEHLAAGFAKGGRSRSALAVSPTVQVAIDGDLETARAGARMRMTLYLGGMGSKQFNFYGELARRMGFGAVADEVQELFLAGEKEKAFNAVPDEMLDRVCLLGSEAEVAAGLQRYAEAGVDRVIAIPVHADPAERLHTIKRLAALAPAPSDAARRTSDAAPDATRRRPLTLRLDATRARLMWLRHTAPLPCSVDAWSEGASGSVGGGWGARKVSPEAPNVTLFPLCGQKVTLGRAASVRVGLDLLEIVS